ncbi:unnamed protein product, partial [Prorocentrum cordatum]
MIIVLSLDAQNNADSGDMTKESNVHHRMAAIAQGLVIAVVGGPPCETWCPARWLEDRRGGRQSRPLRARSRRRGAAGLAKQEREQVRLGNAMRRAFCLLMMAAWPRGVPCIMEHPAIAPWRPQSTASWETPGPRWIRSLEAIDYLEIDQCCLGAEAKKPTGLLAASLPQFRVLAAAAPGRPRGGGRCSSAALPCGGWGWERRAPAGSKRQEVSRVLHIVRRHVTSNLGYVPNYYDYRVMEETTRIGSSTNVTKDAAACGNNADGQCDVPALEGGVTYTHVAAGWYHTVLLQSDKAVATCGDNAYGQCDVPALEGGVAYTHVAAGGCNTVLLRSDKAVAACGNNAFGHCDVPALEGGVTYTACLFGVKLLLQASFEGGSLRFLTLGGVERCRLLAAPGALLADVHRQLLAEHAAGRLGPGFDRVDVVLPE